ncbi:MAG: acyl-CoA dehydrogenase family protein, partial [Oceanicaulis sp.]
MHFTPEHEALRDTVAKFVANEINPHVEAWEAAGEFPSHEVFKKMGDLGLLGLRWPEKYGGAGLDMS